MTTHVMERAHDVVLAPDDDEALARHLRHEKPTRSVDILLAPDAHPRPTEPGGLLVGEHVGVVEHPGWQEARLDPPAAGSRRPLQA